MFNRKEHLIASRGEWKGSLSSGSVISVIDGEIKLTQKQANGSQIIICAFRAPRTLAVSICVLFPRPPLLLSLPLCPCAGF